MSWWQENCRQLCRVQRVTCMCGELACYVTHISSRAGNLAVQVEHQAELLHLLKDFIVDLVALDAGARVGRDASRVALDALYARCVRFADLFDSELWTEEERDEKVGGGAQLLQRLAVRHGSGGGCERWDEVRHDVAQRYAALLDLRCDELA